MAEAEEPGRETTGLTATALGSGTEAPVSRERPMELEASSTQEKPALHDSDLAVADKTQTRDLHQPTLEKQDSEFAAPGRREALRFVAAIEPESARPKPEFRPSSDRIIEALLFASPAPVPDTKLREIAQCSEEELRAGIETLNQEYQTQSRTFRIERIAKGYQLYTLPEYAPWVSQLLKTQRAHRLSKAALETLAIVAYRQPVTKPEIEQLRRVDSTAPLLTLLERRLVVMAGRARKPGHPFLYRTSQEFLRYFGLGSLEDLPRPAELEEFLRHREVDSQGDSELFGEADRTRLPATKAAPEEPGKAIPVPPKPGPLPPDLTKPDK